jgi:hypothetical protein
MSSHLSEHNFFAGRYGLEPKFGKENYNFSSTIETCGIHESRDETSQAEPRHGG